MASPLLRTIPPRTLFSLPSEDYALLDSGEEEKLERWGSIVLARPDPQALWRKGDAAWEPSARFERRGDKGGIWTGKDPLPASWNIRFRGLSFVIRATSFKHTGLFPEQAPNWDWAAEIIQGAGRPVSVLNLFAYTGGATLSAALAGASVCHVDGSKKAVDWAKENAGISGLSEKPIRWIVDDVRSFVGRELKRGNRYDAIVLDPPAFGRGPKDELWKIEADLLPLFDECISLLSDAPLFFLANGYASGYSSYAFARNLSALTAAHGGEIEHGELAIVESGRGLPLPGGIYARWRSAR